jgi:hypothetical protein
MSSSESDDDIRTSTRLGKDTDAEPVLYPFLKQQASERRYGRDGIRGNGPSTGLRRERIGALHWNVGHYSSTLVPLPTRDGSGFLTLNVAHG